MTLVDQLSIVSGNHGEWREARLGVCGIQVYRREEGVCIGDDWTTVIDGRTAIQSAVLLVILVVPATRVGKDAVNE